MNGRGARYVRGALLVLIALMVVGYLRFNIGVDAAYADCRETNDVVVCDCARTGYAGIKSIFSETPVLGLIVGPSAQEFEAHMGAVRQECGVLTVA